MDEPTEKQIKFAESLGIENPEEFSRKALGELIDKKVKKTTDDIVEEKKSESRAPKSGIHLTPESVKIAALNATIESGMMPQNEHFWNQVHEFEQYINGLSQVR